MKSLLIFDLDGTLLNTIADLGEACNTALAQYGYPTHRADEYPHLVGNGVNKLIERALPEGEKSEENILRLRSVFVPYYNAHLREHTQPYEGMVEVVRSLRECGYRLAVASNKYDAAAKQLVRHYFGEQFDLVYGEREGVRRKPDPQIVYDIMQALRVGREGVLYAGDSDVDMQTAHNAGVDAVGCSWGFCERGRLEEMSPKYLIDSPMELLEIARSKENGGKDTD